MEGIPRVRVGRAIPVREEPLEGTKTMLTPHDGRLVEMIQRRAEQPPSRTAKIMGWLAMAGVVVFLGLLWYLWKEDTGDVRRSHDDLLGLLVLLSAGVIHVCALFSQILSNGRNAMGSIALVALYAGSLLLVVLDHLLR